MSHAAKGTEGAKDARRAEGGTEVSDATDEFEEYTAPPRLDEKGHPIPRSKGLNASGYRFPPPGGPQPPLTKENLAKGIGVPAIERPAPTTQKPWPLPPLPGKGNAPPHAFSPSHAPAAPPAPAPVVKVHEDPLFEEYQRPDLKQHPRTGAGLRTDPPPPPSAKELLERYEPPVPEVHTPKRFAVLPARKADGERTQQEDAAHLDAVADALIASDAVMSNPVANGPMKTVVHTPDEDLFAPAPEVPVAQPGPSPLPATATPPPPAPLPRPAAWGPAPAARAAPAPMQTAPYVPPPGERAAQAVQVQSAPTTAPAPQPAPAYAAHPHASDAPLPAPGGPVPRIGLVQCDFNHAITTAMAQAAHAEARRLGAPLAHHLHVPGVFDAPLAARALLERDDVDAVVVVGCVIQGETGHDEVITHAAAQTLLALACNAGKPVGLGVTGPRMSQAQAEARISAGAFAVASVVAQHRLLKTV
jgi:6,7-dimethyl-8-ribityllumazine synthase